MKRKIVKEKNHFFYKKKNLNIIQHLFYGYCYDYCNVLYMYCIYSKSGVNGLLRIYQIYSIRLNIKDNMCVTICYLTICKRVLLLLLDFI